MTCRALSLLAAMLLPGCATPGPDRFPSLAPRAVEGRGFAEPAAAPTQAARADAALDARIAALAAGGATRADSFATARAQAAARVGAAAGSAPGEGAWLDAQVALGELDVLRAEADETATELEQLAADRAVAGDQPYPALDAALAEARARTAEIAGAAATLGARLRR